MLPLQRTQVFDRWLRGLKDGAGRARILMRLERLAQGNPGQVAPIGAGLFELKISTGPGCRVYCLQHGDALVLLLCGGDKSTQQKDIERAHRLADQWRAEQQNGGRS